LADHRRKIDEKNRKGYYVEIKKDTIYFYGNSIPELLILDIVISILTFSVIGYVFLMANEKGMRIK